MALTALIRGGMARRRVAKELSGKAWFGEARLSSIGRAMALRSTAMICIATALPRFEKMRKGNVRS